LLGVGEGGQGQLVGVLGRPCLCPEALAHLDP